MVSRHPSPGSPTPQQGFQGAEQGEQQASDSGKYACTTHGVVVGSSAAASNPGQHWRMTSPEAIQEERQRRSTMWDAVQRIQQENQWKPDTAESYYNLKIQNSRT